MLDEYNKNYSNRVVALSRYQKAQALEKKIYQKSTVVKEKEGRAKQLNDLITANIKELENLEQDLDQPFKRL